MHKLLLTKPDGRALTLYGREPIDTALQAPSPFAEPLNASPHLRWHPLRGEWVTYAAFRQGRTFLPPPEYNPLAGTVDPANPTEVPAGRWDVAVFDNRFPSLVAAESGREVPSLIVPTAPSNGQCEVVVFTQDPKSSLGALPLSHIDLLLQVWGDRTRTLGGLPLWHLELLLEVWADRYRELGARPDIQYVFPFENRGVEVGVTLHHPHGQIYAYPFVPPIAAAELRQQRAYFDAHGRGLLDAHLRAEIEDGRRLLYLSEEAVALMPVCARYSYEVWVAPRRACPSLLDLSTAERAELARALKTVLMKYDGLWQKPFPYILVFHQAPTDGREHPEAHLHIEIYPAYRLPGRLKFLAGSEIGAGVFTADTLPEEKARELQSVQVAIERD